MENQIPPSEKNLVLLLAAIQLTFVLDFMIIMPLGPQLMTEFDISALRLGLLISSYSISAAFASLATALVVDRFGRRTLLIAAYPLFALATLACALSDSFYSLLLARIAAGIFGGLISVLVQTIVADVVPDSRRGRAMGIIMAAFSVATVAGVPISLWIANYHGWQAPFVFLTALIILVFTFAWRQVPELRTHLASDKPSVLAAFGKLVSNRRYWLAFAFTLSMVFTGFVVIPFITAYLQGNLRVSQADVPTLYFVGGVATLIAAPLLGKLSDRFGKAIIFQILAVLAIVPLLGITHLQVSPFWIVLTMTTAFFVTTSGRMIPAMSLLGSIPEPAERGAFMSLISTVQSAGIALASFVGGWLAGTENNQLLNFTHNGWVGAAASVLSCALLWLLIKGRVKTDSSIQEMPS